MLLQKKFLIKNISDSLEYKIQEKRIKYKLVASWKPSPFVLNLSYMRHSASFSQKNTMRK